MAAALSRGAAGLPKPKQAWRLERRSKNGAKTKKMKLLRNQRTHPQRPQHHQHHQQLRLNPKQWEGGGGHQNLPRRIPNLTKTNLTARKQRRLLRQLARSRAQSVTFFSLHQLNSGHIRKRSTHSARHTHARSARKASTVPSSWRPTWPAHTRQAVTPARHVARALAERATLKPTNKAMGRRMRSLLGAARDKLSMREE